MAPASLLVLMLKNPKESKNDDADDDETIDASTLKALCIFGYHDRARCSIRCL